MNLTISRRSLLEALTYCSSAVDRKSSVFAASCVLIEVDGSLARVSATDGLLSARVSLTVLGAESGSFGLGAASMLERIRALPDGEIAISVSGVEATIKQGRRKFTLRAIPGADFPDFPKRHADATYSVPASSLSYMLSRVAYAQREDGDRFRGSELSFGRFAHADATDSRCLARVGVAFESMSTGKYMIGTRACDVLVKLCELSGGTVELGFAGSVACAAGGRFEVAFPLLSETIPDIDSQIDATDGVSILVGREELLAALKIVSVNSTALGHGIVLRAEGSSLHVESSGESGLAHDEIECVAEKDCRMRISPTILTSAVESIDTPRVKIIAANRLQNPHIVYPEPSGDGYVRHIIMPIIEPGGTLS